MGKNRYAGALQRLRAGAGPQKGKTPLDKAAKTAAAVEPAPAIVLPDSLPSDLLANRERLYLRAATERFRAWLMCKLGLDHPLVELLTTYVEAFLVAGPDAFGERPGPEPDERGEWDELDAFANGLTLKRRRTAEPKPAPTLPGCRGSGKDGKPCTNLRRFGWLFCPACSKAALKEMREAAAA